ncbi:Acetyltransferase (GNAT) domain-containing protein [Mariprofundus ferrinatatus]|uniref:Acetyltransferase (GNAT) domain-containing protein n=1 Tax=Mariprofundus ferrinatatus TaxID=1921087 RepID=A0A2K8LCP0_9PROT|nr:GNAT family N-acetyltransferase [Mariprofundus ferrinatatus]ATX82056.1 Acetyltransferase (GNAT) domain-containing protein [Mariprofundus ferrinatatus]
MSDPAIHPVPWDSAVFGIDCFEISDPSNASALAEASTTPGHYSIKVDPLASKALLNKYGFYYTDTLIEPYCNSSDITMYNNPEVSVDNQVDINLLLAMCDASFLYGRFHRDFNLNHDMADRRYKNWLKQLADEENVLGLYHCNQLAGFIAHNNGNLLLHAIDRKFRSQGLAKYFWSAACQELIERGITEFRSSISASNLAVLNLYCSLGFRFNKAVDVYHRLTR